MLLIGSAQLGNMAVAVLRMKALALLLGPAGLGVLGIYSNLLSLLAQGVGLGAHHGAMRLIAADPVASARLARLLLRAYLLQGAAGGLAIWGLRAPLAQLLFADTARADELALTGIAVLLMLLGSAQNAVLQGHRRIADLGQVLFAGTLGGALAAVLAVWVYGAEALIFCVISQPLVLCAIAALYLRRLPVMPDPGPPDDHPLQAWALLVRNGFALMLGGLLPALVLLILRGVIAREHGLIAAGHFAAAWGISVTASGVLLSAMASDFYPRLMGLRDSRAAAADLINQQIQLGLCLGGPALLVLTGCAPLVIAALYSDQFLAAAALLQWQLFGTIFRLAAWPLRYALLSAGGHKSFLLAELGFCAATLLAALLALPVFGLAGAGIALAFGGGVYWLALGALCRARLGFRSSARTRGVIALQAGAGAGVLGLAIGAPGLAPWLAVPLALISGAGSLWLVFAGRPRPALTAQAPL